MRPLPFSSLVYEVHFCNTNKCLFIMMLNGLVFICSSAFTVYGAFKRFQTLTYSFSYTHWHIDTLTAGVQYLARRATRGFNHQPSSCNVSILWFFQVQSSSVTGAKTLWCQHVWNSLCLVFCCQHFRKSLGTGRPEVFLDILFSSRKLRRLTV